MTIEVKKNNMPKLKLYVLRDSQGYYYGVLQVVANGFVIKQEVSEVARREQLIALDDARELQNEYALNAGVLA